MELLADDIEANIVLLAQKSFELAETTEEIKVFENVFFTKPDTNQTNNYSDSMTTFFGKINEFKAIIIK
jgi:hypothetical protein